jgi:hypothetical protein
MKKSGRWRLPVYLALFCIAAGATVWRLGDWVRGDVVPTPDLTYSQEKQIKLPDVPHERYLLLFQDQNDVTETIRTRDNLEMALRYAHLPFDVVSFRQWQAGKVSLDPYRLGAVIVIGERQDDLAHADLLQRYVNEGGGLLVNALRSADSPLNRFMGIANTSGFLNQNSTGLRWKQPVYPGLSELKLSTERMTSSSLGLQLDVQAQVLAELTDPQPVPYVWETVRGKGHTLYWNTTSLEEKAYRGTFVETMLKAQGRGVKMTVGAQVWFIDDFPAPAYQQVSPGNNTGMTDYNFRLKEWDPDMQEVARKYNLRYSTGIVFSYNDRVEPPFDLYKDGYENLFDLETKLVKNGGELGLHGYNHLSLNLSYNEWQQKELGYKPWPSTKEMGEALEMARKLWRTQVPADLPTMYIPPSNVLSVEGKKVLVEMFPELKTISSIYVSNKAEGGFEQEFLPDPDEPQIMGTPRMTYGYVLQDDEKQDLYDGIAALGVVSHFNHPDDVFNADRNQGKTWSQLYAGFDKLVGEVQQRFSWLRPLTATELSDELRNYYKADVRIDTSQPDRINVYATPLSGPMYVEMRAEHPDSWKVQTGGEIVGRDAKYGLLWVKLTEPKLVLEVEK